MERFLEKLESHLTMLEESEQKKIIKRYQKEIEEKIKDGMKEEDALKSLGSIDSIVSDIYEEYHLDKKYVVEKSTVGDSVNSGMRKCANFLADTCAEISYYVSHISNNSLETFFEILLKVIVLVIAIMVFKLPFLLIENFLNFGLSYLFYPFNVILTKLSSFVIAVIYLLICISLAIIMFKGYAKREKKEELSTEKKVIKEKIKSSENSRNFAYVLLKIFLYIIFIVPMIMISLTLFLLLALALFFVYKGVSIIGLVVILVGLLFLSIIVTTSITDALDNRSRNHTFALIVTVISLISGTILFIDNLMNFDYPKKLEESAFVPFKETITFDVEEELTFANFEGEIEFQLDNSIQDNQVLIEVTYFDELYDVVYIPSEDFVWFHAERDDFEIGDIRYLYKNMFKDLSNNKIYEYQKLANVDVVIYGNENTEKLLKIEK